MSNHEFRNTILSDPLIERYSKTNAYVIIIFYSLLSLVAFLVGIILPQVLIIKHLSLCVVGIIVFSLVEYLIHRFIYHPAENRMNVLHKIHHQRPNDKDRLAFPFMMALFLAGALFALCWWALGVHSVSFFSGFILGYAGYLLVHYKIHTGKPPNNRLRHLWTHHNHHHYKDTGTAFGVTSPLWDIVFSTMPRTTKN